MSPVSDSRTRAVRFGRCCPCLSYFGKGEMRERSLGIKIPPTNLKPDFADQATSFASKLADNPPRLDAPFWKQLLPTGRDTRGVGVQARPLHRGHRRDVEQGRVDCMPC